MSLVVAAVVLICPTFLNRYSLGVVNTALIYGMAGWGISVLLGMGGQLSFASISFMGIGGYAVANFCTGRLPFTLPPLAALFASLGGMRYFCLGTWPDSLQAQRYLF